MEHIGAVFEASELEGTNGDENDACPMWWIERPLPFPKTWSNVKNRVLVMRLLRLDIRWFVALEFGYQLVSCEISSVASYVDGEEIPRENCGRWAMFP